MTSLAARLASADGYAADLDLTDGLRPGEVLDGVELEGCRLTGSMLEKAVVRGCRFTDCVFTGCNLSMADLDSSVFQDCRFVDCKALAVSWARARPSPLSARPWQFDRCRLDLGTFRDSVAARSRFSSCSLRDVDFGEADLRRVDFAGSDLAGATFAGTDLREASLLGAHGYAFDPAENRVRGLRLDLEAAGGILLAIGLVVEG
ncbi:MAG: pentapeptide repeat-containing protein [Dermatophilaceae bacterium]